MLHEKDIRRAVKHKAANDTKTLTSKTLEEIEAVVARVQSDINTGNYDFAKSVTTVLSQKGKKRLVKEYEDIYSTESILCQCIKQILDRTLHVRYPNRNKSVRELFNVLTAVKQMGAFTIVKFDFKEYFNSVSAPYVFEKFIRAKMSDRLEIGLVADFVEKTRYAYAGLGTSNVISEIAAKHFDDEVRKALITKGVLFFERYIDDGIIVFNENIKRSDIQDILNRSLEKVYKDSNYDVKPMCKTRFNHDKFFHVSRKEITSTPACFDYLGYEVKLQSNGSKIDIKYGITQSKQAKYKKRVRKFITLYNQFDPKHPDDYLNLELLRHRLATFTSRTVYQGSKYKSRVWKVKGFISNYGELRYLLDAQLVDLDTEVYMRTMLNDVFVEEGLDLPYFLIGAQERAGYNLLENMRKNRTLLLVENIGYDYDALAKLCAKIGIKEADKDGKKRGYGTMVREYLIKTKVGY